MSPYNLLLVILAVQLADSAFPVCESEIFCTGDVLHTIQMARLYPDSKTFVDKKLRFPAKEVIRNFNEALPKFQNTSEDELRRRLIMQFVDENFEDGNELKEWNPPDWRKYPSILKGVRDPHLRKFAFDLNMIWRNLSRKVTDDVLTSPDMYSLIYVPNGFIIPGGRFKELYYWDTYWIVNGLLICDMVDTARGVIENLYHLVSKLGYIPNGSRVYYERRTQPPMLGPMTEAYVARTGNFTFIKNNIHLLDKEMDYWLTNRIIPITRNGVDHLLFRYFAPSLGPRPESYSEDVETASGLNDKDQIFMKWISLKSGAESGWDFSSRWFINQGSNKGTLNDIATQDIVPVDLNALLHKNFVLLAGWHRALGNTEQHAKYQRLANSLLNSIQTILWNNEEGMWLDYDIPNEKPRKYFYMSNFVPLWTGSYTASPEEMSRLALRYIAKYNLHSFPGGPPNSLEYSGEQWDFPNAWPPCQAFFVQGLDRIGTREAREAAVWFASRFVQSNFQGYQDFGAMFEKYDSLISGRSGGGGEYDGQEGFGWTNGVMLEFLARWGDRLRSRGAPSA